MTLFESYLLLGVAALLPVIAAVVFWLLEKFTKFSKWNYWIKQVIFGVIFGALAIVGTEWGIPMYSAQVNCRDAAVLTAGLFFGWPCGIIAGFIGGIERWLAAVFWGVAPATKVACSVSTIIAGLYAAFLRKFFFKNEKPSIILAFFAGFVMETFHLLMVFITNVQNPSFAYKVVNACTIPMVLFNALSVFVTSLVFMLLEKKEFRLRKIRDQQVSTTVQLSLLITCILSYFASFGLVYSVTWNMSNNQASQSLSVANTDLGNDILNTSNQTFQSVAIQINKEISQNPVAYEQICKKYNAVDINLVDNKGVCTFSVDPFFRNVDFNKREDTKEFIELLNPVSNIYIAQKYQEISGKGAYRKYVGIASNNPSFGFYRIGFDSDGIESYLNETLDLFALNRHAGPKSSSYCVIANSNYDVISCAETLSPDILKKDLDKLSKSANDTTVVQQFNSLKSFCQKTSAESYYVISTMGCYASRENMYSNLFLVSFLLIIAFAILYSIVYLLINAIVLRGFTKVTTSLESISNGDLSVNVDVHKSIEFVNLSNSINKTVDTLKNFIDEANERIDKELSLAKDIQASCLPRVTEEYNNHPCFDIHACMFTAKEVGGDFYDFYYSGKHKLVLNIADVSGKGIPAALFMMRSKQELKSLAEAGLPIDEVFTKGNKSLCEGNDAGMFVTVWQGSIDLRTGNIFYGNAGHNAPLVYRASTGKFEYLQSIKGFVMAGLDIMKYKKQELQLDEGDILFLYTDGVTEATNNNQELFGDQRLLDVLNSQEFDSMEQLCKVVKYSVDQFVGEAPQFDDITMVAFKFIKKMEPKEPK